MGHDVPTNNSVTWRTSTELLLIELCEALGIPAEVRDLQKAELESVDEFFFSTTTGGIMPASRLGSRTLSEDRPGPISTKLKDTFREKRRQGWHATPIDY
jgi:branched-chain amino acid aminotransferase